MPVANLHVLAGHPRASLKNWIRETSLALSELLAAPKDRRAIVLISDNQATVRGVASQDRVIRQALESETVIYSVKTPGDAPPIMFRLGARVQGMGSVPKITRETGGEIIEVETLGSVRAAMAAVVARLKTRYTIGYNSSNTASDTSSAAGVKYDQQRRCKGASGMGKGRAFDAWRGGRARSKAQDC